MKVSFITMSEGVLSSSREYKCAPILSIFWQGSGWEAGLARLRRAWGGGGGAIVE